MRILWWSQKGLERVTIWQAVPAETTPVFEPVPYREFEEHAELEEWIGSIFSHHRQS